MNQWGIFWGKPIYNPRKLLDGKVISLLDRTKTIVKTVESSSELIVKKKQCRQGLLRFIKNDLKCEAYLFK